ncbi:MAG: universal stress protein [Deltaproteobacteria bacterium]|nr:universal stress protein [Deltaproteobacteria bacterium]
MFKKILYPTDFSDVAAKALDYIKQLKEAGAQEVLILHVINQRIIDGLRRHAMLDKDILQWQKKAREIAEESLAEMSNALEDVGFSVKPIITTGFPWREILAVEEKEKPSLIVIGSHGRSNLSDMFLGAVSDRVIRKSKGPVMVIKRDPED